MRLDNPRLKITARQMREAERLSAESRRERLDRIFAEVEARRKTPADLPLEMASDLWELARLRDQYRE